MRSRFYTQGKCLSYKEAYYGQLTLLERLHLAIWKFLYRR
jgi:hypothetical protein